MQATITATRNEYRFTGHDGKVYGQGLTELAAIDDARATLGEPMMTQADIDENGYVVEVEQRQDPDTGEWIDVK
jgi:hypothetical protein